MALVWRRAGLAKAKSMSSLRDSQNVFVGRVQAFTRLAIECHGSAVPNRRPYPRYATAPPFRKNANHGERTARELQRLAHRATACYGSALSLTHTSSAAHRNQGDESEEDENGDKD